MGWADRGRVIHGCFGTPAQTWGWRQKDGKDFPKYEDVVSTEAEGSRDVQNKQKKTRRQEAMHPPTCGTTNSIEEPKFGNRK